MPVSDDSNSPESSKKVVYDSQMQKKSCNLSSSQPHDISDSHTIETSNEKLKGTSGGQVTTTLATALHSTIRSLEHLNLNSVSTSKANVLRFVNNPQPDEQESHQSLEKTATSMESSPISDETWDLIYSGKIIHYLKQGHEKARYLTPKDDLSALEIKPITANTGCVMLDGKMCKLLLSRNAQGKLKYFAAIKHAFKTSPIRLMVASMKCVAQFEYDLKMKNLPPSLTSDQLAQRKNEIEKETFHFTVSNCVKPQDVAMISLEVDEGVPLLTITLSPNVVSIMEKAPIVSLL